MTQSELAAAAGLGLSTVVDFEKSRRQVSPEAIRAMQEALEQAGAAFQGGGARPALRGLIGGFAAPPDVFSVDAHMGVRTRALLSAQIRAGRALLGWSAADLARESALGVNTIRRAELADRETSLTSANDRAIRRALEAAGVVFIDEDGGGPGVRLGEGPGRKSRPKSGRKSRKP
jgi:transcriptional regulator with XRE-family HTH domain